MRPLRVALVHRVGWSTLDRTYGPWSYPVPEFEVTHYPIDAKYHQRQVLAHYKEFDVVVHEDGKCYLNWDRSDGGPPLVYVVTDSTLSQSHYDLRHDQARQADLVLVDWDDPARFAACGGRVVRCPYSVNDRLFYRRPVAKSVDVAFVCNLKGVAERELLDRELAAVCYRRNWRYESGRRIGEDYALAFSRARVAVHLERNPQTRAHRCFDALAAGACLLTNTTPAVMRDDLVVYLHYWPLGEQASLEQDLAQLLATTRWQEVAESGHHWVMTHHTWALRARWLRELFAATFGLGD